jgi:hypothetical protein
VRSEYGQDAASSDEPFSTKYLSVHTECSRRNREDQPHYIVLMCIEPGGQSASNTVIIPMESVASQLRRQALEVLANTRYLGCAPNSPLVLTQGNSEVFAFRDFLDSPLDWVYDESAHTVAANEVNLAIEELTLALYQPKIQQRIGWTKNSLLIVDNRRFFHGKTAAEGLDAATAPRHLKRLRIV